MWPGASVSGFYFAHPQARYFALGKVERDQMVTITSATNELADVKRWLGPWLNYDPEKNAARGPNIQANTATGCSCGNLML